MFLLLAVSTLAQDKELYLLNESYNSRQIGLGRIDAVVSGGASASLNNPALLGILPNAVLNGSIEYSYDHYNVDIKKRSTWGHNFSAIFETGRKNLGVFSMYVDFLSKGKNSVCRKRILLEDSLTYLENIPQERLNDCDTSFCSDNTHCTCGQRIMTCRNIVDKRLVEYLLGISYAREIIASEKTRHSVGITLKSYYGRYYDDLKEQLPVTFDFGYVMDHDFGIRYGMAFRNIGPEITWYSNDTYYDEKYDSTVNESEDGSRTSPFIITTGLAYNMKRLLENVNWLDISLAGSCKSELKREPFIEFALGFEVTVLKRLKLRSGFHGTGQNGMNPFIDTQKKNITFGLGGHFKNISVDLYYDRLTSPYSNEYNTMGISLSIDNLIRLVQNRDENDINLCRRDSGFSHSSCF